MKQCLVGILFMVSVGCFEPKESELDREIRTARERNAKQSAYLQSPEYKRKVFTKLNKSNDAKAFQSVRIP